MTPLKIEVRGLQDTIKGVEKDYADFLERVGDMILEQAPKFTPVRTGRARASWEKRGSKDNIEVVNTQPYAIYLEKPYLKSKQAPLGIVGPTLTSVKGKLK
jgi:hypothetical protein